MSSGCSPPLPKLTSFATCVTDWEKTGFPQIEKLALVCTGPGKLDHLNVGADR